MAIPSEIAALASEMTGWRRYLHAHPELGYQEFKTSDFVAQHLTEWGIPFERITETGIVATLQAGDGNGAIALRADMDALPMEDQGDAPWVSTVPGVMHGCGHDGHTATLLGAMKYLSQTRRFSGTVHAIFQPAEEGLAGAKSLIDAGLFEKFTADMVFGQHNDPLLPEGVMSVVKGPTMAASDRFSIKVKGKGGHAARPHHTLDPLIAGAQVALSLQTILSRRIDPLENGVVSVTQFHAGTTGNVIPEVAELAGTVRTLKPEVQSEIEALLFEVATSAAATVGAVATVDYRRGYPAVINADGPTRIGADAAAEIVGEGKLVRNRPPAMGGEDFAFMAQARPGCFARIGTAKEGEETAPLHSPRYDFNDSILPVGAAWFATIIEKALSAD
ncbi:M20 aminoacylase family protein [Shimia sp. R9_3]|uniref:M20 aminoacylase family protein n=1 Tax=Shimia sp. R9_3 TaxID=2821113 RepID=UPI001ADB83C2|nr:M20 aminoacylase family protein [Shimia sp. R9_3]MBO9402672.1 amidohydrolase [Shimia sp. R9_3]